MTDLLETKDITTRTLYKALTAIDKAFIRIRTFSDERNGIVADSLNIASILFSVTELTLLEKYIVTSIFPTRMFEFICCKLGKTNSFDKCLTVTLTTLLINTC